MKNVYFMIMVLLCTVGWDTQANEPSRSANTGRALSLNEVVKRLQTYQNRDYPRQLKEMASITELKGYVIDNERQDVILFGTVAPNLPALHLEELVIALQNVARVYAERSGNRITYSYPGCSIDPDPQVMARLDQVGDRILDSSDEESLEQSIKAWYEICRSPQDVKVFGIPFHSGFARVLVQSDYDMKRLADGSDSLEIPGFLSLTDISLNRARENYKMGRRSSDPVSTMNRFWFYPGRNRFLEDVDIVSIQECQVQLLTEEEMLTSKGTFQGSGKRNRLADKFAKDFTAHYEEIARIRPVYRELENLYRMFVMAKIFEYRSLPVFAQLTLKNVWRNYRVATQQLRPTVPGRANVKGFEYKKSTQQGYEIYRMWLPSCGGVGMDFEPTPKHFIRDRGGNLQEQKKLILDARPQGSDLFWDFPMLDKVEQFDPRQQQHSIRVGKS